MTSTAARRKTTSSPTAATISPTASTGRPRATAYPTVVKARTTPMPTANSRQAPRPGPDRPGRRAWSRATSTRPSGSAGEIGIRPSAPSVTPVHAVVTSSATATAARTIVARLSDQSAQPCHRSAQRPPAVARATSSTPAPVATSTTCGPPVTVLLSSAARPTQSVTDRAVRDQLGRGPGSGQVGLEPGEGAVPGVSSRSLVVVGPHIAVEPVTSVGIADDLGRDRCGAQRVPEPRDVLDGEARVLIAEQSEPGGAEARDLVDEGRERERPLRRDPAAVEPDRGTQGATGGDEERCPPTEAEPHGSDAVIGEPGSPHEFECGVDVNQDRVVGHPLEEGDDLVEVDVVVVVDETAAGTVEQRGGDGVVSRVGEAAHDRLDMAVDAERLLDDDHGPGRGAVRRGLVDVHRSVGGGDGDGARPHHETARGSNATLMAPERSWFANATNASRQSSSAKVLVSIPVRSTRPSLTSSR